MIIRVPAGAAVRPRRLATVIIAATLPLVTLLPGAAPAQAADPQQPDRDYQLPTRPQDVLDLPSPGEVAAAATARYRFGLSYVVVPIRGMRNGFSENQVRAMTRRVASRMADRTDGRFTFGTVGYTKAPAVRSRALGCNLDRINELFSSYARRLNDPPPGYRDTIAVYLTPLRWSCRYAGVALLGGRAVYLNGIDLADPQRLQDWITAHELGHTLGLEHSAAFWPGRPGWDWSRPVPAARTQQNWYDYGDYTDLMGQPPKGGLGLPGARFGRWTFNSLSLLGLGVLGRGNVAGVTTSRTVTLPPLRPDPAAGRMVVSVPVTADGRRTAWVLEYRPPSENTATVRLPQPYASRGYGVRLMLAPRGLSYPLYLNRLFRVGEPESSVAILPVGRRVLLSGGAAVTVQRLDAQGATVSIQVP